MFKLVAALPKISKMVFAAENRSLMSFDNDEYPKNDKMCIALLVFPEPDSPVKSIDCGLSSVISLIILLAEKKNH